MKEDGRSIEYKNSNLNLKINKVVENERSFKLNAKAVGYSVEI